MALKLATITFDCTDHQRIAAFWIAALGYEHRRWTDEERAVIAEERPEYLGTDTVIAPPGDEGVRLFFQKVPEPKTVKNRVHVDLVADDPSAEIERLLSLGATVQRKIETSFGDSWTIMEDPEGNEFCVS